MTDNCNLPRVNVVGLRANVCGSIEKVVERTAEMARLGTGDYVCFSTVHMAMESYDDREFAKIVNGADFIVTDGMPLVWMQKLQGAQEAARVRANDLMMSLCEYAEKNNLKIGFYGGKSEVIEAIRARAAKDFPNLQIVYAFSPPFRVLTEEEDREITDEINGAGAQILFVGLGCPKQERWMAAHSRKIKAVMLGVGASFDFYAGNVSESPAWLGNIGLEWLYRLSREPRRLWRRYLILNPRFMTLAALQLAGLKKFREETPVKR
jgi:N-acetylglucosaminyldiphosphoundecaprenol N-acetyl-beta-D-mannosaminyltransferase